MPAKRSVAPASEQSPTGRALAEAVNEDLGYQIRSWRIQRLGWAVGGLILVAAFLGLLGGSPWSTAEARSEDGRLEITYQRFARHGKPLALELRVQPDAAASTAVVWITRDYLDGLEIHGILPEPSRAIDSEGRTGYEFELADVGAEGLNVTFLIEYDAAFLRHADVTVDGGPSLRITQFVYP